MNRPSLAASTIDPIESLRVSLESLAANKLRSSLTMLGVIIGVTSVILLVSLGQGARAYVDQEFSGIGTNLLFVNPGKTETKGMGPPLANVHKLTLADADALRKRCPALDGVVPTILGSAPVKWLNRERNTMVIGVNEDWPRVFTLHVEQGSFFKPDDAIAGRRVVVLGPTVKRALFLDEPALGRFVKLSGARYRVIGVMARKGTMLGFDIDDLVYIPTRSAQKLFNVDRLFQIRTRARSAELVAEAIREVTEVLKKRHNGNEDFNIVTQASMLSTFGNIMGILTAMLGGIAGISLFVGGIGIMNIMLVSVTERTREIGIRMAVGARRGDVLVQFLIESATLSSLGGAIGIALGVGISLGVRWLTPLPAQTSVWSVGLAFFLSAAVGVFFGVWPARKAAQLDPIEALRYE